MRLGDLDQFKELFDKQVKYGATDLFDAVEDALQDTEIIYPETLPIVRELRANIAIQEKIIENHHNPFDTDQIVKLSLENSNLKQQLDNIDIQEKDGTIVNLGEKYGKRAN